MSLSQHSPALDEQFWAIVTGEADPVGHRATMSPFDDPMGLLPETEIDDSEDERPGEDDGRLFGAAPHQAKAVPFGEPSEGDSEEAGEEDAEAEEEEGTD